MSADVCVQLARCLEAAPSAEVLDELKRRVFRGEAIALRQVVRDRRKALAATMTILNRWKHGHAVALSVAALLAAFCACVHVARGEALPAAVAGLLVGDFSVRARLAWWASRLAKDQ